MPILGHGIDIVETRRIADLLENHGERFLERCFTTAEREYCYRNNKRHIEHLAGRFAAKEAVLKVLGTGWRGGIAWTDIELPQLLLFRRQDVGLDHTIDFIVADQLLFRART